MKHLRLLRFGHHLDRRLETLLLAAFALVGLPCAARTEAAPAAPPPLRNAVLVSIDSLRADHLSLYGYPRETTPQLDRLVQRLGAVVFTRDTTASPSCHPSHATMLTGLYPQMIGVPWCGEDLIVTSAELTGDDPLRQLDAYQKDLERQPPPLVKKKVSAVMNWLEIPQGTQTLATFLEHRGFRTGGFVSIWTVHGRFGYARGFDRFVDRMPEYYGPPSLSWLLRDTFRSQRRQVGAATLDSTLAYLDQIPAKDRFFLFVHLADTHVPYAPRTVPPFSETPAERRKVEAAWEAHYPEGLWERAKAHMTSRDGFLLDRYDRSIRYEDAQLGRLFAELERRGHLRDTLVIVTADHGDSFGQHLYLSHTRHDRLFFEHSVYVWEETQHVPLIVFDPALRGARERRAANVSPVDIVPTVLTRLGFDPASFITGELPGTSLLSLRDAPRTVFFLTFGRGRPGLLHQIHLDFPKFIGFRSGDLKFFVDRDRFENVEKGRCFLYDLARDPNEEHNLCEEGQEGVERAERFRAILVDWYTRSVEPRQDIRKGAEPTPSTPPAKGGKGQGKPATAP